MKKFHGQGPLGGSRMNPNRRRFMTTLALAVMAGPALAKTDAPLVEVWKDPSCGCCQDWVKHLQTNGFQVKIHDAGNTDARVMLGMPLEYGACHSARVKAYAIEGHVPAREIHRLLRETPPAIGLAVPAMPVGSPGMDGPEYGNRRSAYDVLLVQRGGGTRVYASYR